MRLSTVALIIAGLTGATVLAQPAPQPTPPKTIQCLAPGGRSVPAFCDVPSSRLDDSEYLCTCPAGGQRVAVSVCRKGQTPPAENQALNLARREASRDGSLIGDMVGDKPICAAPRNS